MDSSRVIAREQIYTREFGREPEFANWPKSNGERYIPLKFVA